jgi:uncharacterized ferritin-like protein (DUF455 family)
MGYDLDDSATRFSNYLHVLRELVHLSCGHLALEPRFEVKALLGDHLHDDARAVSKVHRRLYELRTPSDYPGAPSDDLAAMLDRANEADTAAYLEIAYGDLKPTLIAALRIHLAGLDPLIDEPSLRLLTQLLHRQERHVAELPAGRDQRVFEDLGALPVRLREVRSLKVMPPLDRPERDTFIEVTDEGDRHEEIQVPTESEEQKRFFHGLMDAELCAAELMARNSHEHPDMPWDFHVDMARQTWDEIRHAEIHDRLMTTELGCHWGDYPVGFGSFRSIYALDLLGRLALFNGTSEQMAMWRHSHRRKVLIELGQETIAQVFDYLLADEVPHVHNGVRWGTHLLGGDEQAYRDKVRELRAGLDRTGAPT